MFLHLITLCIGLLIAAGLQQTYEFFQRRRERAYLEAQLAAERKTAGEPVPPPPNPTTPYERN